MYPHFFFDADISRGPTTGAAPPVASRPFANLARDSSRTIAFGVAGSRIAGGGWLGNGFA